MALKRARAGNPYTGITHAVHPSESSTRCWTLPELAPQVREAGEELRRYVLLKRVEGEISATMVCELANLFTGAGGCGLEDLCLKSDSDVLHHANEHVQDRYQCQGQI